MKKRGILIILSLLMALSLMGCQSMGGKGESGEKLYDNIDRLIKYPESESAYTSLPMKFSFTGMVLSEPFEMEMGDDELETRNVFYAGISRNMKDMFLVDVTDVEFDLEPFDLFEVTVEDISSVYWTEEGRREEVINFVAKEISAYTIEKTEPLVSDTIAIKDEKRDVEYKFLNIEKGTDSYGNLIVLYFEFTNNGTEDAEPNMNDFMFFNGEEMMVNSSFGVKSEVDPNALYVGIVADPTYPSKTQLYYVGLKQNSSSEAVVDYNSPLEIEKYDDNFKLTYYYGFEFK